MKLKGLAILALVCVALGAFAVDASAGACRNPGSLLLFPYYNTVGPAGLSVMTITNTGNEDVWLRLVWVAEEDCIPRDAWLELTRKDTFTFLDQAMFFGNTRGFLYVYVVDDEYSVAEQDYDFLVGQELVLFPHPDQQNQIVAWGVNAVAFQALQIDTADGNLHLDGTEFTLAPKMVYFPRFFGQPEIGDIGYINSLVILINLTGGTYFEATANVLVYNDNEKAFSDFVKFPCWHIMPLNEFSLATRNDFLLSTDHDEDEPVGLTDYEIETGWISMMGQEATNIFMTHTLQNPSVYGVLVETIGMATWAAADLPWTVEDSSYGNGMLWSTRVDGGDN